MDKKERFWLWFLLGLIALGWLTSCKTKYVTVPEYHTVVVNKHDTMITRDSIYMKDSIYMWKQGDTIWKEKVSILYRDRWRDRIVYRDSVKVDSIRVPYPVERQATFWEKTWMKTGKILSGIAIIFIVFLVYRLARSRI